MKLNQMITIDNSSDIGNEIFDINYQGIKVAILIQLYFKHGAREVRDNFTNESDIIRYIRAFMRSNKQKFIYIFDSSQEDFLSQDNLDKILKELFYHFNLNLFSLFIGFQMRSILPIYSATPHRYLQRNTANQTGYSVPHTRLTSYRSAYTMT